MSSPTKPSSSNTPSFNWLPPRPDTREIAARAAEAAPGARPCLPAIEALDDRILLSAVVIGPIEQPDGAVANPAVLTALFKSGFDLLKAEVAALKFFQGGETDYKESSLKILTNQFLKLDQTLLKIGDALLVGDLTGYKYYESKVTEVALKIDALLPGDEAVFLPAVQRLVKSLAGQEGGQVVSKEDIKLLSNLSDQFFKIDQALLKFAADPTGAQFKQGLNPAIKITQDFVKIDALLQQLDPDVSGHFKSTIDALKIDTFNYLKFLTSPIGKDPGTGDGELSSIGQFTGGVVLPDDPNGDVLA